MTAASAAGERLQLAKHCRARDWSKAISVLNSLLAKSPSVQDYCNRAFCYSKLELHKHVMNDCDRALAIDRGFIQAYILKGNALSVLDRKEDALHVWENGYENVGFESTDLKLLLELEELLVDAKRKITVVCEELAISPSSSITSIPDIKAADIDSSSAISSTLHTKDVASEDHAMDSSSVISSTLHTKDVASEDHAMDSSSVIISTLHTKDVASEDHAMDSSSVITTASDTGLEMQSLADYIHGVNTRFSETEICSRLGETTKVGRKVFGAGKSKTSSVCLDFRLSRGIAQVNEGKYDDAISIFDQILTGNPQYPEALIARGTAHAFQRELSAAIDDFTRAIEADPSAGEAWKRRGQARAALGYIEAMEDLTTALEFEPRSLDILHERGIIRFKFQDYAAAVEDLSECISRDKNNKSAYTYLGLALSAIGDYHKAEEAHRESINIDQNFIDGWMHLAQHYQDLANPEMSFDCLEHVLRIDERFSKARHMRGLLYHGMGQHRIAIKDLSLGLEIEDSNIECLYLRASCYHAIGEYGDAVKDYDAVMSLETDSDDKFLLQCLAFYQKEIALYTASKVTSEFCWFDIDNDVNSLFKEYWCKKAHPQKVSEKVIRQPSLRDSLKKGRPRKQEFVVTKHKVKLLQAADIIGRKIQYDCAGFLPNRRQYRMAGLAAIEIAQKVSKHWRSLRQANKPSKRTRKRENYSRGGLSYSTSNSSETSTSYGSNEDGSTSGRSLSWQDVYSLAVKWRQISEPCDPVVWINKLSEKFNSGYGSHKPILLGQGKDIRYFPNYQRTIFTARSVMRDKTYVYNLEDAKIVDISEEGKLQSVLHAQSCSDLYNVVGQNFWVATTCNSTAFVGKHLEGTRISVKKLDTPGFNFEIKTPCTTSRWDDYDEEMAMAWEVLCNAYCGAAEVPGPNDLDLLSDVKDSILRITYYWYNFMPLSQGSAVVGYTVLLGLFLAANMEVTTSIPPGVQVDWEAILSSNPNAFIDSVKTWLYPSLKLSPSWKGYPDVASTFETTGSVVAALSSYDQ